MAKKTSKKQKSDKTTIGQIADLVAEILAKNGITPEQLLDVMSAWEDKGGMAAFYDKMYNYKKPDYSKMAAPLHPVLAPLVNLIGIEGITALMDSALIELKKEDPEQAGEALLNALYYILANQKELLSMDHTNLPLYAMLHMMIELDVKEATPAVLELLRQDGEFMSYYFDVYEDEVSFAIAKLCAADLEMLEDFMYEPGLIYTAQCIVADGVTHMALIMPEMRTEIIAWWARVLKKYAEIDVEVTNIDHISRTICQLHAVELKPLVEHLYKVKDVPFIENADYEELENLLTEGTDERRVSVESVRDVIAEMENKYLNEEDDEDSEDFDFEDEDYEDEEDNDEADELCVYELDDGMIYRLEITIDDCPVNVVREVIVPSNIRLNWLGKVLVEAMGWNGTHLNQFSKGNTYYADEADTFFRTITYKYSEFALKEILSRKGSKINWEYDFGDGWVHTIKLVEKFKYRGDCRMLEVTKAENACPPDDCGGVWGYADLLEALKDKKHPEHKRMKEWVGRFDPYKVSLKALNENLDYMLDE